MSQTVNLQGIKNIIFDLGGVILNIDYQKPVDEFKKLGVDDFAQFYSQVAQSNLFSKLETGKINSSEFYNSIREVTGKNLPDKTIEHAWNSIIENFPAERIELIAELKKKFNVFLLSNTNHIHYEYYNNSFKSKFDYPSLDDLFHKAYFSHKIGLRKPDRDIYEFVLKDSKLIPQETLFVEDTSVNLVEAKKLNIQTLLLESDMRIEKLF